MLDDPAARKCRLVLLAAYKRQRVKSWARVAAKYGLSKSRAYMIAKGERRPNPETDKALYRAVLRESEAVRAPKKTRRLILKIAVPFLARRQRSGRRLYGPGGKPV